MEKIKKLILNSLSDDYENLEQIYKSIAFDFSSELYESNHNSYYLRPSNEFILLSDVINNLIELIDTRMVSVKNIEDANPKFKNSFIWESWFYLTEDGKNKNKEFIL